MPTQKAKAPIVLLTDFGTKDHYAGVMKGVILSIHPSAVIVDLSHDISSYDITSAYFQLLNSYAYFPAGSIFVAVVDPGVGSDRKILCVTTGRYIFLAPDNGILSFLMKQKGIQHIYEVADSRYFLPTVSDTFQGRDVFAPVAAHLSRGLSPKKLGPERTSLMMLDAHEPRVSDGVIEGRIVNVDKFGNAITNIHKQLLPGRDVQVRVGGKIVAGLSRNYASIKKGGLGLVIGSADMIEIATHGGNAAEELSVRAGDRVVLQVRS